MAKAKTAAGSKPKAKKTEAKKGGVVAVVPGKAKTSEIVALDPSSPEALIAQAIDKNLPVETMERLLAMRKELKAEAAREAFVAAMSKFQGECPIVEKKKSVAEKGGGTRYKYAPLDVIVAQVRETLSKNELAYTVDAEQTETAVTALCKVTHVMGHSETSKFTVPIDPKAYMSAPQKFAAALTFAKRYAFCNALGILTGDEDTDAAPESVSAPQAAAQHQEARGRTYQQPPVQQAQPAQQAAPAPQPPPAPVQPPRPQDDNAGAPCPKCGEGMMELTAHNEVPEKWLLKCSNYGKVVAPNNAKCTSLMRLGQPTIIGATDASEEVDTAAMSF